MNRLGVLQVGKFYPPHMGGIETHLRNLCGELAKSFRVDALVANDGRDTSDEIDGEVYVRRAGTLGVVASAPLSPGLFSGIRHADADILHLHLPNPAATLAVLASGYRGAVITTYHSDVVRQKVLAACFEPFLNAILRRSAAIICTSQRYLESSPALARFREKCVVIPYGIPVESVTDAEPEEVGAVRSRYGSNLILTVGRLVYYKGFEYLIDAMRHVNGRLLIIGDGPLRTALEKQIRDLALGDRVELLGEIQNARLAPFYRAADIFAFPSIARSEAFGIVQIEAMACGLPIVNTDLDSGVPYVSRHCETGFTVPPRDPPALADALNTLLGERVLRAQMAAAARRRVHEEFTVERMTERTLNLYRAVLAGEKIPGGFLPVPIALRSGSASAAKRTLAS